MKCDTQKTVLILILLLCNINFCLAAPFLPLFLDDRGISSTWTGIIFAIFSVASTITSILIGKVVDRVGHKPLLAISTLFMSAFTVATGLINSFDKNYLIILAACFCRIG